MPVRDRHDENPCRRFDAIDDSVGKTAKQKPTSAMLEGWPRFGIVGYRVFGCVDFVTKGQGRGWTPLGIPTSSSFDFLKCLVDVLKLANHVRQLRGSDAGLLTNRPSSLSRRRPSRDVRGFLPTTPLRRPHRPVCRDSESARLRSRRVLLQAGVTLREGRLGNPCLEIST